MRGIQAGLAVAALILAFGIYPPMVANAQAIATTEPGSAVYVQPLINTFLPWAVELALAALVAIAGIALRFVSKKWNLDTQAAEKKLESFNREALHLAITTAVANVIARNGIGKDLKIEVGSPAFATILDHILRSVPDAMKAFTPSDATISNIATAKAVELSRNLTGIALPIPLGGIGDIPGIVESFRQTSEGGPRDPGDRLVGRASDL